MVLVMILPSFGGLSFPCPCCFSLAFTTLLFCPGALSFLDYLLGFLTLDFQCCWLFRVVCTSIAILSGWVYGADTLSFHFIVSTWFFFPSFGSGCASFGDILCAFSSVTFIFIFIFVFLSSLSPGPVWPGCVCAFSEASFLCWADSCSASFYLCMWFRQNLGVSSLRRSLWWSAGCSVPGTFYWCCGILSLPYRILWALGRGFFILSSFLRLRVPFYGLFRQLAAIGVLFVVFLLVVA